MTTFPEAVVELRQATADIEAANQVVKRTIPLGQPWLVRTANNYQAVAIRRWKPDGDGAEWVFVATDGRSTITEDWPLEWLPIAQLVVP